MKRIFTILASAVLLTAAMCVTASASSFDNTAKDLSSIGMFRGTGKGFELDRAPTRSEAAIMLVRLYGAEGTAKADYQAGKLTSPFTDVSETVAPYAAWLYSNGITKGTGANTFGGQSQCNLNMYCSFLLRALGYEDGKDFSYATAPSFAMTKGILSSVNDTAAFLRDDLAAVTYQALGTDLKDGSTYLLDSLIKSGAIDAKSAEAITGKIETYRSLLTSTSAASSTGIDADYGMTMTLDMKMTGKDDAGQPLDEQEAMNLSASGRIQMLLGDDPQLAMTMKTTTGTETQETSTWLKDGWMYVQSGDMAYKTELEGYQETLAGYQELMNLCSQLNASMLPYISSITSGKSGSSTVYTMTLDGKAFSGMIDDIMGLIGTAPMPIEDGSVGLDLDMDLKDCTYTYTINQKGQLTNCKAVLAMDMKMNIDAGTDGAMALTASMKADVNMKINAMGSDIKITYPDFSKFQDIAATLPSVLPAPTT